MNSVGRDPQEHHSPAETAGQSSDLSAKGVLRPSQEEREPGLELRVPKGRGLKDSSIPAAR